MIDTRTAAYGALILRVTLGTLLLAHFGLKYFVFTPAGTVQFFTSIGLPAALAYLTMLVELVAGAALVLGVWARLAALAAVPILLGAILFVHGSNGFFFSAPNGGWEFPAFWALALIVQALVGDGALALLPTSIKLGANRAVAARP
ncbi:MAG TPA: DoxX family protein [Methylomirabilota bacterium]|nr:DoxX family protein [Methylomirabilota bacterium]